MSVRWPTGVVCLGLALAAQACAGILGFDEDSPVLVDCTTSADCPGVDDACQTRTCVNGTCGVELAAKGLICNQTGACDGAGHCTSANGIPCLADEQCFHGHCVDGVCCDVACMESCMACKGQGNDGTCKPIPANTDPDNECPNEECNGAGACEFENGESCSKEDECKSGFCVDGACCDVGACTISGATCATGQCTCPAKTPMVCADVCKDLATDDDNCGMCGKACATSSHELCQSGVCENLTWALWPMPNPKSTGLPTPSNYTYDVDNVNGVATDNVTKLMWEREVDPTAKFTWEEAKSHCANLVFAGYDDWRLPTRIELVSLIDFTKPYPGPTIDTDAFPDMEPGAGFWTSSHWAADPSSAWVVNFNSGNSSYDGVAVACRVRCVR